MAAALTLGQAMQITGDEKVVSLTARTDGFYAVELDSSNSILYSFEQNGYLTERGSHGSNYFTVDETRLYLVKNAGGDTVNVTAERIGDDLNDLLAYMGNREGRYWFNVGGETIVTDTLEIPQNVTMYVYAPLTVANGGTLINRSDIFVENGGSLTVETGGKLQMVDNAGLPKNVIYSK